MIPPRLSSRRDFLGTFYFATAMPVMGLFALEHSRLSCTISALGFTVLAAATIVPIRVSWMRNLANFFLFIIFLLITHVGLSARMLSPRMHMTGY